MLTLRGERLKSFWMVLLVAGVFFLAVACTSVDGTVTPEDGDEDGTEAPVASCVEFKLLHGEAFEPSVVKLNFQLTSCSGIPLAGVRAEQFRILEDGAKISVYESNQGYAPDPATFRLMSLLLLDMSGSIRESGALPKLLAAAKEFVLAVADSQSVAIYAFDGSEEIHKIVDFTQDKEYLVERLKLLSEFDSSDDSTNLNGAILQGVYALDSERLKFGEDGLFSAALIAFTDGKEWASYVTEAQVVHWISRSETHVYTIGLGDEISEKSLETIGKDGFYLAEDVDDLNEVFQNVAFDLLNLAYSYYALAYCSARRAGYHEIEVSLVGAEGTMSFRFNAEDFKGGCSPSDFLPSSKE